MRASVAGRNRGFTLLEVLVAASLVLAMVVLMAKFLGGFADTAAAQTKRSGADREAKAVFDRLAVDLGRMLRRPDLDYRFEKREGNDALSFLSGVSGYSADDTHPAVSVVSYGLGQIGLRRGVQNRDWTNIQHSGTPVQNFSGESSSRLPTVREENFQVLGPNVCRLEFCFLLGDGSFSSSWINARIENRLDAALAPTAADDASRGFVRGSWWIQRETAEFVCVAATPGNACWIEASKVENITGVLIAIAVLDEHGQGLQRQGVLDLDRLARGLLDFNGGPDIISIWESSPLDVGLPTRAAAGVRFYQRLFLFH